MLVLSRKPGEELVIGGSIRVKVVEVRGERVRLAIDAPREVSIHRAEIAAALAENERALRYDSVEVN